MADDIKDLSERELAAIAAYLASKADDARPIILVGGWAVYAYNPYEKSTDIDLILGSKRRARLLQWLRTDRGYRKRVKHIDGWSGASRFSPGVGMMIVDVAGFDDEFVFFGRQEQLNFDVAIEHSVRRLIAEVELCIPTRSLLLLYKAKAAFDRAARIVGGESGDARWEQGKLGKDRSDIIAILDSKPEAPDWEIGFLGQQLERLPFLVDVLRLAARDEVAVARYGKLRPARAATMMDELLATLT